MFDEAGFRAEFVAEIYYRLSARNDRPICDFTERYESADVWFRWPATVSFRLDH